MPEDFGAGCDPVVWRASRAALPPGLEAGRYLVLDAGPDWPWVPGSFIGRATLRRMIGGPALKEAESEGRVELIPGLPEPKLVEWVVARDADPDLRRAPRQRQVFDLLKKSPAGLQASALRSETGISRSTLRALEEKGAINFEKRPEPLPIFSSGGTDVGKLRPFLRIAGNTVDRGGAWIWRTPTDEQPDVAAAFSLAAVEEGGRALVLAPERARVEHLVGHLRQHLPTGYEIAAYHSGLGKKRAAVYARCGAGEVEVLVGTRAAALVPLPGLETICVVDEPDEAHRAEPGYEGLPMHVRDVAQERGRVLGATVLFLSPHPSLEIYAPEIGVGELPPRSQPKWPSVRIVDMKESGAAVSSTLIEICRKDARAGKRVGVVANRLGYATAFSCNNCGSVCSCPGCRMPLTLYEGTGLLVCGRCGFQRETPKECGECGSVRLTPTGLPVGRVRRELSDALASPVGLLTADAREFEDAAVVVGTARCILGLKWDTIVIPDADTVLMGSGMKSQERAFRLLYGAAESAGGRLLVQTRLPGHRTLQAALRDDYPAFAKSELPRLRALGYPPYGHMAEILLEGAEETVRRAVELELHPALEKGVEMQDIAPLEKPGKRTWRVLLRSGDRAAVARAGTRAARLGAKFRGRMRVRVNIDPEEV